MSGNNSLTKRAWFNLCFFGFMGQIAWALENMYFNTFLFNTVYDGGAVTVGLPSMKAIRYMVAFSSLTAVLTTFIMGNLSDKVSRRKIFISVGYLLWGVTVISFGFITKQNVSAIFGIPLSDTAKLVTVTSAAVIFMDCVMTFMGSTANDSAFNAWVTDITNTHNRATVESVLSLLPIASMVIVVVAAGFIEQIGYPVFFFSLGALVMCAGFLGFFTLKDSGSGKKKNENYFRELFYGFKPSVIKSNSRLYIALLALCIYCVAVQVWFPYLLIYLEHSLNFNVENLVSYLSPLVIVIAVLGIAAAVAVVIGLGKVIDRVGKEKLIFVFMILFIVGLVGEYFAHTLLPFGLLALPMLLGYAFIGIMLNATVRDFTPPEKAGLFQGIRMIFIVLIPMVAGPWIGDLACKLSDAGHYVDEMGNTTYEPSSAMFLAAAAVSVFCLIPVIILRKKGFKVPAQEEEEK